MPARKGPLRKVGRRSAAQPSSSDMPLRPKPMAARRSQPRPLLARSSLGNVTAPTTTCPPASTEPRVAGLLRHHRVAATGGLRLVGAELLPRRLTPASAPPPPRIHRWCPKAGHPAPAARPVYPTYSRAQWRRSRGSAAPTDTYSSGSHGALLVRHQVRAAKAADDTPTARQLGLALGPASLLQSARARTCLAGR